MQKAKIRYIVDDTKDAIQFYTSLLGFELKMHRAPGFAALENDEILLFLNQPEAGGAGQAMPVGGSPKPGGWNRIQIQIDNLNKVYSDFKEQGATFRNAIVEGKGGKQVLLQDPSGNLIELFESTQQKQVEPVPEGYHTVTPFLLVNNAEELIEFIKKAFGGTVDDIMKSDDGSIRHSTVKIGDSLVMISDGTEQFEPMPCMLHLYVEDVDSSYEKALQAGGISLREPEDQFYGDRSAGIQDKWKNQWWLATHIEDVDHDDMKRREEEFRNQQK